MSDDHGHDDLDQRIADAKAAAAREDGPKPPAKGYSQGSRVLAELIGAPAGGAIIGWALDYWFGTSPWLMLILLGLAIVAAGRNIYRISKEQAE